MEDELKDFERIERPDEPFKTRSEMLAEHMRFHGHTVEVTDPKTETATSDLTYTPIVSEAA